MRSISHVRRRAATSIEYALILILIAAIIIGSVSLVGVNLNNVFQLFQSVFSSQSLIGGPWFSEGTANGGFTSNSTTDGLSYYGNVAGLTIEEIGPSYSGVPSQQQSLTIYNTTSETQNVPVGNQVYNLPSQDLMSYNSMAPNSFSLIPGVSYTSQDISTFNNFCSNAGGTSSTIDSYLTCSNLPSSFKYSVNSAAQKIQAPNANLFND